MFSVSSEQSIVNNTAIQLAKIPGVRIWRANTGSGVGWGIVRAARGHLDSGNPGLAAKLLSHCRPVQYGVPGQADLSGILGDGRRLEVELKTSTGKQREQQERYEQMIKSHGGVYILARSAEEAEGKVKEVYEEERIERLDNDLDELEDYIRWLEYESGQGSVNLTRDMYEQAIIDGLWIKGDGE